MVPPCCNAAIAPDGLRVGPWGFKIKVEVIFLFKLMELIRLWCAIDGAYYKAYYSLADAYITDGHFNDARDALNNAIEREDLNDRQKLQDMKNSLELLSNNLNIQIQLHVQIWLTMNVNVKQRKIFGSVINALNIIYLWN